MSPDHFKKQQGFLIPLAIFIVVVMGFFALVISRNTIQTSTSVTLEAVSTQAFYAAESGAQMAMQNLFFPNASSRQAVDGRCATLSATPLTRTYALGSANDIPGLNGCTLTVSCACKFQDNTSCLPVTASNYTTTVVANRLTSFYTITSGATCGVGTLRATRTIEAGSFLKQE